MKNGRFEMGFVSERVRWMDKREELVVIVNVRERERVISSI